VKKHAKASQVEVNLVFDKEAVRLRIHDSGIGFDSEGTAAGAFGLISMRERARLLGGTLVVQSGGGKGTLIQVTIPVYPGSG